MGHGLHLKSQGVIKMMLGRIGAVLAFPCFLLSGAQSSDPKEVVEHFIAEERLQWYVKSTVGPMTLGTGLFTQGIATARNKPEEYGSHVDGFGKRYGLRLSTLAVTNAYYGAAAAALGEDPRYRRVPERSVAARIGNVFRMTVMSRDVNSGKLIPDYAGFIARPAGSFTSNFWRPDSQATMNEAIGRVGLSFLNHAAGNAFMEFWPDLKKRFRKSKPYQPGANDPQ